MHILVRRTLEHQQNRHRAFLYLFFQATEHVSRGSGNDETGGLGGTLSRGEWSCWLRWRSIEHRLHGTQQPIRVHVGNRADFINHHDLCLSCRGERSCSNHLKNGWHACAKHNQDQDQDGTDDEAALPESIFILVFNDQADIAQGVLMSSPAQTDRYDPRLLFWRSLFWRF